MAKAQFWDFGARQQEDSDDNLLRTVPPFASRRRRWRSGGGSVDEALQLMKTFEESRHGWFWSTDAEGHLIYLSDSISEELGAGGGALLGSRFAEIFVQADEDATGRRGLPFLLARHSPFEKLIVRAVAGESRQCWSVWGCPQFDRTGRFTGYRGSALDVTEHRRSSERASQLAKYDSLTRLPNRLCMNERLEACLLAAEHHKKPCAVLLIDLDRFKQVNDTLGHPAGDMLLRHVAERLVTLVGDREKVFRLGGDEFQIMLQNTDNRGIIGDLANDVIASLSQPYSIEGSRCVIGASIGIAIAPVDGFTKDELIRNADLALYASKSGGRGRFRFFSSELLQAAEDKRMLEEDLRDALARGEISLAYQPIAETVTNRITGVEALLRWQHPTHGAISPAVFVPIAEEAGLIGPLGEWALRKACEEAVTWPGRLRVAVNVSPLQFRNEGLASIVLSALAASGLEPDRLELEITEGVFLREASETDTTFAAIKEIGVRLALDDFGTGYSSLGYLRTAPFDKIKIDQTFVREATLPKSRNSAIIAAIVALAEALGMETTAEGIEYMDQLRLIRGLRVSHVQGWVYSKAVSSAELIERLDQGDWVIEPTGLAKQRSERQSMYRKVGVIHGGRYADAVVRNLSDSGALLDGTIDLTPGDLILVDFGDGQVAFARVARTTGRQHGIAFEQPLVDDGNGGLCTSHRVSPYMLSTMGLPSPQDPNKAVDGADAFEPFEELARKLGVTLAPRPQSEPTGRLPFIVGTVDAAGIVPTFRELSARYLEAVGGDEASRESARRDLRNHILPRFGQLRLDQMSQADLFAWLAAKVDSEDHPPGTADRLHQLLSEMWSLAIDLELPGAEPNPLAGRAWFESRRERDGILSADEALALIEAARASHNRQLKYILALLMLTGARQGEILKAKWEHIDQGKAIWRLPRQGAAMPREVRLTAAAAELLAALPRCEGCPYLIANPKTKKPYNGILKSWEVARTRAGLPHVEIDDLRYCDIGTGAQQDRIVARVLEDVTPAGGERANPAGEEAAGPRQPPCPDTLTQAA